ncbi:hypothetical protein B9T25_02875 [Acinetobacter sp. ANC 4470]|uniref:CC0125/CC1285 family lipoprotein n=1 Tax=Acinetobacter sp. ANC 4470 TaxID=1977881 RepID=UPI000A34DB7A|nr:hypothetical protein [Acinetobacter sp. ANC 4470]OTG69530.1 hypothetical protein B9T25_02875 [Acinetobacter sp. ANC 4470]
MKKNIIGLTMGLAIALSGCAMSPSKPLTFDQLGQFSQTPLNAQSYRISFHARSNMSFGTAEEITLVKAAQTTLQNGFRYFKVLNDPSNVNQPPRKAVVYSNPMHYPYSYHRRYPGYWSDPFYNMPQVVTIDPVQVSYTIECYKDQKKAPDDAFDATLILQSLGQKYGLSPTGQVLTPQTPTTTK